MRTNVYRGTYCDPIRIRVQCHPRCGTQQAPTYSSVLKENYKSIILTLIIGCLIVGIQKNWKKISQQASNPSDFNHCQKHLGDMERSLYKKMDKVDESDIIENLVDKINVLQDNVKIMHTQLQAVEKNMKIQTPPDGSKQIEVVDDSTLQSLKEELLLLNLDKTGRPDYALHSSGGCVVSVRDTKTYMHQSGSISLLGIPLLRNKPDPVAVIQKNMSPGECWAFEGDKGTIVIELIEEIFVTHVTLEHIPKQISPNLRVDSAPKQFDLWGLKELEDENPHLFGNFQYDASGSSIQTFPVMFKSENSYGMVEFTVKSNHGHPNFTCIYRIRIHGRPKNV